MRKFLILINILLMIFIIHCSKPPKPESTSASRQYWTPIPFNPDEIEIEGDLQSFAAAWEREEVEEGLQILTLILKSPHPAVPPQFLIKWSFPAVDVSGFWNTNLDVDRVNYWGNRLTSKATSQAPVMAFINNADLNRFTFACSDALNQLRLRSYIREEDARLYCSVELFGEKTPALTEETGFFEHPESRKEDFPMDMGDPASGQIGRGVIKNSLLLFLDKSDHQVDPSAQDFQFFEDRMNAGIQSNIGDEVH